MHEEDFEIPKIIFEDDFLKNTLVTPFKSVLGQTL